MPVIAARVTIRLIDGTALAVTATPNVADLEPATVMAALDAFAEPIHTDLADGASGFIRVTVDSTESDPAYVRIVRKSDVRDVAVRQVLPS